MRRMRRPLAIRRRRRLERPRSPRRCSPAAAPRWLTGNSRASPLRSGRLRPIIEDHTISKLATDADLLAPVLARHLDGRPRRPAGYRPAGPAGRWPLPAVLRRTRPGRRRPTALLCTHFARCIRRRVGQLAALAGSRASESRLTLYRWARPCMRGKPAPGSRLLPKFGARRSAAITGTARGPAVRPPPPSCPMRLSGLAYHRRDNVPGQIRAQIRPPGPSAKITQGARPLRQEPLHAT